MVKRKEKENMKVLSLYDGMSCGNIALKELGIEIDEYISYEIDKYAIKVTQHNFPKTVQMGDVYGADFTVHKDIDWLIGGFPCTKFSIAQKNDRETEPYSGLGWELFMHYKRALEETKPKYFLAENNKSMAKPIRDEISRLFGFEPICINSALVSAQNRQRLYWVGKRNEDGTYSKVNVEQPEDRGILLRDVLDSAVAWQDKSYCITTRCSGAIPEDTLTKHRHTMVGEPVSVRCRGREVDGDVIGKWEARTDKKNGNLTANAVGCMVAEPIRIGCMPSPDGTIKNSQGMRLYSVDGKAVNQTANGGGMGAKTGLYAEPVEVAELSDEYYHGDKNGQLFGKIVCKNTSNNKGQPAQGTRIYNTDCKSICLDGDSRKYIIDKVTTSDGKSYPIYEVKNGQITIKDKQYPIKLSDGYYIIRILTVSECKRLQTVPEWYDFSVISNSRAYQCLGNGWTVEVIKHLIVSALNQN